jgi:glycosyltransferase involved in cell wall biosynthesis
VQLTIVGGGEVEGQLKELVKTLGLTQQIAFTGSLNETEKNAALRRAHFLVHTSLREGWGLNVIEANAMGTPAAVYPVGGLVDSVVAGKTGLVVAEETPKSLATALSEVLKNPAQYESYRRGAWERAKSFQWSEVVGPTCDWLERQASGKR